MKHFHSLVTTDKEAMKYLKKSYDGTTTFEECLEMSQKQAMDKTRMPFDIHISSEDGKSYTWGGRLALLRMEGEGFDEEEKTVKNIETSENKGKLKERIGEMGVILPSKSQNNGIFTEAMISVFSLGFDFPTSIYNPIPDPKVNSGDKRGFGLSKIFVVTHHKNSPMRGWMEKVLKLKVLEADSDELTQSLKDLMKEEKCDEERAVIYCLKKLDWENGKREELIEKVEKRHGGRK